MELRRYPRFDCRAGARIWSGRWLRGGSRRAAVLNFSETGACLQFEAGHALKPGQRLRLSWRVPVETGFPGGGRSCSIGAIVRRGAPGPGAPSTCGVAFDRKLSEQIQLQEDWPRKAFAVSMAVVVGLMIVWIKADNLHWFWHHPILHGYSLVASGYVALRLCLALMYRLPSDNGYFPTVSVCITAMNEEDCIAQTIECCYASRYPSHLIEVIAVDDGSTDRTWERMRALKAKYPSFKPIRFARNLGKRFAMAAGAKQAKGEILVYVDSDTFASPDGVYRLVQPFVDPQIGAVAGHILVELEDNYIAKMESVRYYASHRINKAGESLFGCVTCCSGAFSAYRKIAVMEVMQAWLRQKFLGVQATFGDDRSLTNFVLKRRRVIFHDGARCTTKVPGRWMKFFKQQLRWKKSWTRETLVATRFMYKEHPLAALAYYLGVALTLISPWVVVNSTVFAPLLRDGSAWHYLGGLVLTYLFLCMVCLYHTRTRYWAYGLTFAVLYIGVLAWQNYYAMITVNKTKWGTR